MLESAQERLAQFLRQSRENACLSQWTVSQKMGYSTPQFVSNWERGISQPPVPTLKELAIIYNVEASELFDLQLKATIEVVTNNMIKKFNAKY